jgi:hypothetical protein
MADFRKWFFALVALAVLVGITADTAAAQSFQCTANAGVPARVRGEGRTELVGDMLLNCNGTVATSTALLANIQIFLSTNITSRITNTTTNATEALLMLGDPLPAMQCLTPNLTSAAPQVVGIPSCGTGSVWETYQNVYQGVKAGDNSLLWLNVPIVIPPATTQVIRITNVRANANQAFSQGQTFIPQQITMFVTVSSSVSIPINNPTQVVAAVLKGLDFAVVKCTDETSSTSVSGQQCVSRGKTDPTATDHSMDALLKYSEGFDVAFKIRKSVGQDGANLNVLFNSSESAYINSLQTSPYGLGSTIGFANTGSRLLARFANIPTGVLLFVTTSQTAVGTTATVTTQTETGTTTGTKAVLVSVTDPTGSGGSKDFPISYTGKYTGCSATIDNGLVQVPLFGGAGAATWEIIASTPGSVETIAFGVETSWSASPSTNSPALTAGTPGTVAGSFAPISSDDKMSATSPIPRFADTSISKTLVEIGACVTNLLFPFVSARGGFDTGIAISNTTLDNSKDLPGGTNKVPFNTSQQNGACTLYYFGDKEDGTSLSKPIQTSGVINAGKQLVYTLFGGGSGIDATPGFQGYIIARCAFQKAHGFAFISDLGAQKLAMGYLPLIMSDSTSSRDTTGASAERLDN